MRTKKEIEDKIEKCERELFKLDKSKQDVNFKFVFREIVISEKNALEWVLKKRDEI